MIVIIGGFEPYRDLEGSNPAKTSGTRSPESPIYVVGYFLHVFLMWCLHAVGDI